MMQTDRPNYSVNKEFREQETDDALQKWLGSRTNPTYDKRNKDRATRKLDAVK